MATSSVRITVKEFGKEVKILEKVGWGQSVFLKSPRNKSQKVRALEVSKPHCSCTDCQSCFNSVRTLLGLVFVFQTLSKIM